MVLSRWKCVAALAVASCLLQGSAFADDNSGVVAPCSLVVSAEDAARGLDIVSDTACAEGGEGCIDKICRHCRTSGATGADVAAYPTCASYLSDLSGSGDDDGDDDDGSEGSGDSDSDDDGSGVIADEPNHLTSDTSVSGDSYGCPYKTSGGDFDVGIQLVGDVSCSKGGLGCFAGVCRFCQFKKSPQSGHLLTCESLGYKIRTKPVVVPVLPPVNPDTGCPFNVSKGDFDVGIQLVGDASCGAGGLGCYKDICRFCKFKETPQSKHWRSCADFGYPHTTAPPAFSTVSLDDDNGEWTGETACAYAVSPGDFAVGVQLVGDASCASGGLGCYGRTCRFCQFRATPQSKHMLTCKQLGYPRPVTQPIGSPQDLGIPDSLTNCPFPVSPGDFAAGIQLVGDATCAKGGLGCFKDACRYCKFKETPQSKNWVPCSDLKWPPVAPPVIQPADVNEPAVDFGTGCPHSVSSGDYAVGIQLVGDESCSKGGLGCFKDVCRYCKFQETPQSKGWVTCASLGWPRTVAPIARPVEVNTEDPATECPYPVSKGDFDAGIQLVGDASCVKGGIGCYKNVCRFCKFRESPESKNWVPCSDLGYPRNNGVFKPVSIDENSETGCQYPVSSGDYAAGIQLVGDSSCSKGGVGCYKDTCRFCKFRTTPQSSAYLNCEDLGYFFGTDSGAIVPTPPSTGPSTKCPFTTSPGDQAAGVLLVGDASCDKGGIGCYEKVCRYCQLVPTEKSNQFVTCTSLGFNFALPPMPTKPAPTSPPPPPPTTTAPPPTTAAPTAEPTLPVCPTATVSPGDYAFGINLVGDPTCASGGIGCFGDKCRYCKFKDTPQAANWLPCTNFLQPVAAPADIVDTPPPTTQPPAPTPPPATPPPVVAKVCETPVSQGDRDAGVGLVTDYSCLVAGLGCVEGTICRFCRVFTSEKSAHLDPCSLYGGPPLIEAPSPAALDPSACVSTLADGDIKGGVGAFYDPSCSPSGGLGCFGRVCRYCQAFNSDKSEKFVPCPTPAPTPASVEAPSTNTDPAAPAPESPTDVASPDNAAPAAGPTPSTDPNAAPAAPPVAPVDGNTAPVAPAVAPADPNAAPGAPPVAPVDPNAAPGAPPVDPVDPNAAPGAPPVDPVDPNAGPGAPVAPVAPVDPAPADPPVALVDPNPAPAAPAADADPAPPADPDADTPVADPTTGPSTDANVAPPAAALRAAATEYSTGFAAAEQQLDELLQDTAFRWAMVAAACVGTVAVVAVIALGAKRAVARRKARPSDASTASSEPTQDKEDKREPTPLPAAPTPTTGVLEAEV